MTNTDKESKQTQKDKDAQAIAKQNVALNAQDNAGIPPPSINPNQQDTAVQEAQADNNGNRVSVTQEQRDAEAKAQALANLSEDQVALRRNEDMNLLKRIVGKASPVIEEVDEKEEQTDADGNKVQVPVKKKVTTGYFYYAVNGKKFVDWVKETFNGEIEIDEKNNKIIYNNKDK